MNLLRCFYVALLAGILTFTASGQGVWKATHPGHPGHELYLVGTMHLLPPEAYPISPEVDAALEEAEVVIFETFIDELNSPAAAFLMMSQAGLEEGKTLSDVLPPELYVAIQDHAEKHGLAREHFDVFRPWFTGVTLSILEMGRLGFRMDLGLDPYLYERAKEEGKEIEALETVAFQIGLFTNLEPEDEAEFLAQTLEGLETFSEELDMLLAAWKEGDEERLNEVLLASFRDHPEIYAKFLTERNVAWIPQIEEAFTHASTVLVAVGAAHLPGGEGVLDLLRNQGFEVEVFSVD